MQDQYPLKIGLKTHNNHTKLFISELCRASAISQWFLK